MQPIALWPQSRLTKHELAEDNPTLTPFLLGGAGRGCVIVFPGGGYGARAEHERTPIARWFNSLGVNSFVLDYRVAPYRHPVPLQDALRAIRIVRARAEEFGVNPSQIGVLGFSAGGHLAASAATLFDKGDAQAADPIDRLSSRPDAAILCYPVISTGPYGHEGSMNNLLGENPDPELLRLLSLESSVTADNPPTFLWHTSDDEAVPVENSLMFAAALRAKKVPFALHVYPHGRHGLGLAKDTPEVSSWTDQCALWLRGIGFAT